MKHLQMINYVLFSVWIITCMLLKKQADYSKMLEKEIKIRDEYNFKNQHTLDSLMKSNENYFNQFIQLQQKLKQ